MKKLLPLLIIMLLLLLLNACDNTSSNDGGNNTLPPNQTNNEENTPPDNQPTIYLLKTYSSTDEYGNAGTYTEINDQYSAGEQIELEATVKSGYNFVGWFINNTCISKDLKYSFTMKSNNIEIEARYNYFTVLTSSDTDNYEKAGTYTELKSKKISVGEQVSVEATVNAGYNFEGWFINDICVGEELTYSFVMKEKNVDVEARWSYYTVSVNSHSDEQGTAGTFTKKNDEKISAGETVTLTATVADGYNFEGWYIDGVCICSELTYQFIMDKSNKNISAEYSYYTLTTNGYIWKWSYTEGLESIAGTYTKYDETKISEGKTITLVATLGDGYTFKGWYIRNVCVSTDLEYSYTMNKDNVEIKAMYTYYTLTTGAYLDRGHYVSSFEENMGSYSCYNEEKIRAGETVTLTATVKSGYRFVGWEHGNTIICTDLTYTFIMGTEDEEYSAVFEKI